MASKVIWKITVDMEQLERLMFEEKIREYKKLSFLSWISVQSFSLMNRKHKKWLPVTITLRLFKMLVEWIAKQNNWNKYEIFTKLNKK